MDKKILWIWLTTLSGITNAKISTLLERFDSVEDIYAASEAALLQTSRVTKKDAQNIVAHDLSKANEIWARICEIGAWVLCYDEALYPSALRELDDIPYVLYGMGEILSWDRLLGIAVVGTRDATQYGLKVTEQLSYDLAQNGVTVIAGMARGIDTAAHTETIAAGGKTIAVLGCGIDVIYPAENRKLYAQIIKHGAVITEFAPGTPALASNFPRRNRIIAALGAGTLVTEAPVKSGALITASKALNMGKDVFAVPGDYNRYFSQGCNDLIQNSGAKLCEKVEDILEEYTYQLMLLHGNEYKIRKGRRFIKPKPATVKRAAISQEKLQALDDESREIVMLLAKENMHLDALCGALGKDAGSVSALLTMLELSGLVQSLGSNNFGITVDSSRDNDIRRELWERN